MCKTDKNKIVILIPLYALSKDVGTLMNDLMKSHFTNVVFVKNENLPFKTDEPKEIKTIIHNEESTALEKGFEIILKDYSQAEGVIVVGADSQYSAHDIERIVEDLATNPDDIIFAVRKPENTTKKAKLGDRLINALFDLLEKRDQKNWASTLRALSTKNMKTLLDRSGNLESAEELGINIRKVPIYTEEQSFYERLMELIRMYRVFIKFTASSLFSTVVDLGLFAIFIYLLRGTFPTSYIMISTIIARVVSIFVNYTLNNKLVFKRKNEKRGSFIRYITLAIIEMLGSGMLVTFIVNTLIPFETFTKILVDGSLFFVGFLIQRKFVFTKE